MSIRERYEWFFSMVETSQADFVWTVRDSGQIMTHRRSDGSEVNLGAIFDHLGEPGPEFGVPGMATSRAMGPYEINGEKWHTPTSDLLREQIFQIIGHSEPS